jgi:putative transposase
MSNLNQTKPRIIAMKKTKFTEEQIAFALCQAETGIRVEEVCRQLGISQATFFNWKKKFGVMGVTELRRLRQLEAENTHLKKLVADLSLNKQMLQEVLKKNSKASDQTRTGHVSPGRVLDFSQASLQYLTVASFHMVLPSSW